MREETVVYKIYRYEELNDDAKEKVKKMFSEWQGEDSWLFTEDCNIALKEKFPKSDLKVEYSLGYCQGDGLNIYGILYLPDMMKYIDMSNDGGKIMNWIFDNTGFDMEYKMPCNNSYCYCICNNNDYSEDLKDSVEDYLDEDWYVDSDYLDGGEGRVKDLKAFGVDNIMSALDEFSNKTGNYLTELCGRLEEEGYNFFYHEFSEEEAQDMADANEYEFYEDGTLVQEERKYE